MQAARDFHPALAAVVGHKPVAERRDIVIAGGQR